MEMNIALNERKKNSNTKQVAKSAPMMKKPISPVIISVLRVRI